MSFRRATPRLHLRLPGTFALAMLLAATSAQAASKKHTQANRHPATAAQPADEAPRYADREDVQRFAADVAARHGLDAAWVRSALAQARYAPAAARFIMPPPAGTAKNWAAYRSRFIDPVRVRAGAAFWQANRAWLALAEERYGVPPAIVVGIVGVESIFGQQMGNFRVLDALTTLGFDFPAGRKDRSAFFRDELEQFLLLCQREGVDATLLRGSYAGAMGMPQFMPSSANKWAVDFDGDGRIDLHRSTADVIGSVANYLAEFGWKRGQPTHLSVAAPVNSADRAFLLGPDILPTFSVQDFADRGARLGDDAARIDGKLALVELQNGDAAPSYVAGTANFYAITRYNWSSYYAMAVIELGNAVAQRVSAAAAASTVAAQPVPRP